MPGKSPGNLLWRHCVKLFCLLLVLGWSPAQVFSFPPHSQRQGPAPLPPAQFIRSHDYDVRHIKLDLRFDWDQERVLGKAQITFAPLASDLRKLDLDAADMTFSSVRLGSGAILKYEADAAKEKLRITLDRAYQPSEVLTVLIEYQTNGVKSVNRPRRGVFFVKPTPDDPAKPKQIWSQGQPEYSHYWFPCFDHPNDFATSELTATVEKPNIVISNGKLLETKTNSDGTRTFHWKMEQPHAAYLVSIVVGEFTPIETSYAGTPVITYVQAADLAAGRASSARLAEVIGFISKKTGLKYPYAKYSQVFVRDFEQIEGMENISASTITDLILQDARSNLDQSSEGLQVHEVAHQWFGNYVTARSWSDIWLSEGFAIYVQALWDEHMLGRDDFLNRMRRNQNVYHAVWANGSRHPLVNRNYASPDDTFDLNAYRGGAVVLHMLRTTLGEENWWRAVRHYLKKYAHQPAGTEQFRVAIEEATGQPLDWFFDQWVYRSGIPVLQVTQNYDPAAKTLKLTVRQKQKPDTTSGFPQAELFRLVLDVEIGTASGTRTERILIEPKEEQSFDFAADSQPLLVNFDRGSAIFKRLEFEKPDNELIYQLAHDEDVNGRFWAFGQLLDRLKAPAMDEAGKRKIAAAFAGAVTKDSFWGLRVDAANALASLPGDATRAVLVAATKDRDARVRASATSALRQSKDATLAGVYQQLLSDRSYATVRTAALALGETHDPEAFNALVKLLESDSWRDTIRISAMNGLGLLGDRRAFDIAVRFASDSHPTRVRIAALALAAAVGKQEPRARALLFKALSEAVTANKTALVNATAQALVELGDPEGLKALAEAREKSNDPQVQSLLRKAEELLRLSVHPAQQKPSGR